MRRMGGVGILRPLPLILPSRSHRVKFKAWHKLRALALVYFFCLFFLRDQTVTESQAGIVLELVPRCCNSDAAKGDKVQSTSGNVTNSSRIGGLL